MATATAAVFRLERADEARRARAARAGGLVIDLAASSLIYAVVNNVYGVPGYGASGVLLVVVWLAYVTVPEAIYGATLGKLLTGVCVVRLDGRPLGLRAVIFRNLGRFVDALPFLYLLGGIVVMFSGNSQRVGDLIAGTTVVRRELAVGRGATRRPFRGAGRALVATIAVLTLLTAVFDYFGRPALVVEGFYRGGQLQLDTYSLASPKFSAGGVRYALTGTKRGFACTGYIDLAWSGLGWDATGWTEDCPGAN